MTAPATKARLQFRVLGPIDVVADGSPLRLAGEKPRALLAFLLLHANELVSRDRLVDALWGERSPATATASLQVHVAKVRTLIEEAGESRSRLETRGTGYVLHLEPDELDASCFEALVSEARRARAAGDQEHAAGLLSEALALWRGPAFADLWYSDSIQVEGARLEEVMLTALEDRIEADLELGRHAELVAELERLVALHPTRERLCAQLMLALYRSGRQAEALEAYRRLRQTLAEELGLEPGPDLRRLERSILQHAESLAPPKKAVVSRGRDRPRLRWAAVVLVIAALAGSLAGVFLSRGRDSVSAPVVESASDRTLAAIPVPLPACCGFGFGSVWAAGHHDRTVQRIDPGTNAAIRRIASVGYQAGVPLVAAGSLWVPSGAGEITRIDPTTGRILARIPVSVVPLAFGFLTVWGTTLDHRLVRINLQTNRVVWSLRLASGSNSWVDELAIGYGSVWVAVADSGTLLRIDPTTRRIVARIGGFGRDDSGMPIAIGEGAVWALRVHGGRNVLFRVDPDSNRIVARIPVGPPTAGPPTGTVTVGDGFVWTGNSDASVSKVDPEANTVVATYRLNSQPQNLSFGFGSLWVDSYDASQVWRIDPRP